MTPDFLTLEDILEIHLDQIDRYGGLAAIRDIGLLQSAIAMPESTFDWSFLHADLLEMAAAYLFHIVQDHPFVDGNKRTGAVAALLFLAMNDVEVGADEDGLEAITMAVARGEAGKDDVAEFIRRIAH